MAHYFMRVQLLAVIIVRSASYVAGRYESVNVASPAVPAESKRIFGVIPNNRTSPGLTNYKPLSAREKFEIARQDSSIEERLSSRRRSRGTPSSPMQILLSGRE
jgi:hypothetical protein